MLTAVIIIGALVLAVVALCIVGYFYALNLGESKILRLEVDRTSGAHKRLMRINTEQTETIRGLRADLKAAEKQIGEWERFGIHVREAAEQVADLCRGEEPEKPPPVVIDPSRVVIDPSKVILENVRAENQ